jgi:hypothetical protein
MYEDTVVFYYYDGDRINKWPYWIYVDATCMTARLALVSWREKVE